MDGTFGKRGWCLLAKSRAGCNVVRRGRRQVGGQSGCGRGRRDRRRARLQPRRAGRKRRPPVFDGRLRLFDKLVQRQQRRRRSGVGAESVKFRKGGAGGNGCKRK